MDRDLWITPKFTATFTFSSTLGDIAVEYIVEDVPPDHRCFYWALKAATRSFPLLQRFNTGLEVKRYLYESALRDVDRFQPVMRWCAGTPCLKEYCESHLADDTKWADEMSPFLACIVLGLDVIIVSPLGGLNRPLMHMATMNSRQVHALFAAEPIVAVVYHHTCGQPFPINEPLADINRLHSIKAAFNHYAAAFSSVVTPFPIDAVYNDYVVISDVRRVQPVVAESSQKLKRKQTTLIELWKGAGAAASSSSSSSGGDLSSANAKLSSKANAESSSIAKADSSSNETDDLHPPGNPYSKRRKHGDTNYVQDPDRRCVLSSFESAVEADVVRRAYIDRGPCQPRGDKPRRQFGKKQLRFQDQWYTDVPDGNLCLEYSESADAAFCLPCYLFNQDSSSAFVSGGYTNWKKFLGKEGGWTKHVGGQGSEHRQAVLKFSQFQKPEGHIHTLLKSASLHQRELNRRRLLAIIDVALYTARQGLAFRGHDESGDSLNRGNFLELLHWHADRVPDLRELLDNAPAREQYTSPTIQKDILNAAGTLNRRSLADEVKGRLFTIIVDESKDSSGKEQMTLVIRWVDDNGCVCEEFLDIVHVKSTSAADLYDAVIEVLERHGLSLRLCRGQGYDGASNMSGEWNGLQKLIRDGYVHAMFFHCPAHRLQLVLVAAASSVVEVALFFKTLVTGINISSGSAKRKDQFMEAAAEAREQAIADGAVETGRGLNQATGLARPGDTRWGTHGKSVDRMVVNFGPATGVIETVAQTGSTSEMRADAAACLERMWTFTFVIIMFIMKSLLGITKVLSDALQQKDIDIVNCLALVAVCMRQLQHERDYGWGLRLQEAVNFCGKHGIEVPDMAALHVHRGRPRRNASNTTNEDHYRVAIFNAMIDNILAEFRHRFNDHGVEILTLAAALSPMDNFAAFDRDDLVRLAEIYNDDFTESDIQGLGAELDTYIAAVLADDRMKGKARPRSISELSKAMVSLRLHLVFPLVHRLMVIVLTLPVSTATGERVFSSMRFIKNGLRSVMGEDYFRDCMSLFVGKERFGSISSEDVLEAFMAMKDRLIEI